MTGAGQPSLFVEDVFDALRSAVDAAGGRKRVGALLWPAKGPDAAGRYLADCLNPSRSERLNPEEFLHVLRLARDGGYHGAKHWIDVELGYAPTPPVEPDDQAAELARVISGAGDTLRRAVAALEKLQGARR